MENKILIRVLVIHVVIALIIYMIQLIFPYSAIRFLISNITSRNIFALFVWSIPIANIGVAHWHYTRKSGKHLSYGISFLTGAGILILTYLFANIALRVSVKFLPTNPMLDYSFLPVRYYNMRIVWMQMALLPVLLMLEARWMIYTRLKEKGYASLIPFYRTWTLCRMTGKSDKFILLFIPVLSLFISYTIHTALAKKLEKEESFGLGLWLLPIIFYPMAAFKKEGPEKTT